MESISNIVSNGINIGEASKNKRRGLVNINGFYTIELTEQDSKSVSEKLSLAYQFGANRTPPEMKTGVLIMQLCEDDYNKLAKKNQVLKRPIAGEGLEEYTETIFKPESFATLNQKATFPKIIRPPAKVLTG